MTLVASRDFQKEKGRRFESRASGIVDLWRHGGGSSERQSGRNTLTIGRFMRDYKIALVSFAAVGTERTQIKDTRSTFPDNKTFQYRGSNERGDHARFPDKYLMNSNFLWERADRSFSSLVCPSDYANCPESPLRRKPSTLPSLFDQL